REGQRKQLQEIAIEHGVAELVHEDPRRATYRRSLELLLESDGALVFGVDDLGYMPSKLYTYALSGKPLLAILRHDSTAAGIVGSMPDLARLMTFGGGSKTDTEAASSLRALLQEVVARAQFDRRGMISDHLAPSMARRHASLFDRCIASNST